MDKILFERGNLYEKCGAIKRKRPKKALSRDIASSSQSWDTSAAYLKFLDRIRGLWCRNFK
jgi:hypothetical protein